MIKDTRFDKNFDHEQERAKRLMEVAKEQRAKIAIEAKEKERLYIERERAHQKEVDNRNKELEERIQQKKQAEERSRRESEEEVTKRIEAEVAYKEKIEAKQAFERRLQSEYKSKIGYTDQLAASICSRIASGELLKNICEDQTMPFMDTVLDWITENPEFRRAHELALDKRDYVWEDELIAIADDSTNDYIDKVNRKTGESFRVIDPEVMQRSKMRIDMRLRVLKMRKPDKWGDNPDILAAQKKLLLAQQPSVTINFVRISSDAKSKMIIESKSVEGPILSLDDISEDIEKVA